MRRRLSVRTPLSLLWLRDAKLRESLIRKGESTRSRLLTAGSRPIESLRPKAPVISMIPSLEAKLIRKTKAEETPLWYCKIKWSRRKRKVRAPSSPCTITKDFSVIDLRQLKLFSLVLLL